MSRTWKIIIGSVLMTLFVQGVATIAIVYSGAYDVAATVEHSQPARWLLGKTTERSIAVRADDESFSPPADQLAGFKAFDTMCVQCHGAPGVEPSWLGKGISPPAPDLSQIGKTRTPEQIRLAIRRGIKFTAMPALERTHEPEELDALTALVLVLPELSSDRYSTLRREHANAPPPESDMHGHH